MATRKKQAKVDRELRRQLETTAAPVEAVVMLRQSPEEIAADPDRTEALAKKVIDRVTKQVRSGPKVVNVFRNMGSFLVAAEPEFVRELIDQPEVASVVANRPDPDATH
jgi:hypothetical protein